MLCLRRFSPATLLKTNRPPTDQEKAIIHTSMAPASARLKVVREQISETMAHVQALQSRVEQAEISCGPCARGRPRSWKIQRIVVECFLSFEISQKTCFARYSSHASKPTCLNFLIKAHRCLTFLRRSLADCDELLWLPQPSGHPWMFRSIHIVMNMKKQILNSI